MKQRHKLILFTSLFLAPLSAVLSAAPAAAPLSNQERMPAFSWDRVPRYIHIRKDTAFTSEEIKHLATFPLITFEKSTGNRDSGSTEAGTLKAAREVKAINPATKILYYRNVIVHYGGYAANTALEDIPGTLLAGRDGNEKIVRGNVPAYNLDSKPMRDWWLASAQKICADPAIDGLFLDGMVKVLEPGYLRNEIGDEKKAAGLAGYHTMMKDTRQMLGPKKLMVANVLRARFADSGLNAMKAFDGSYIEGFEGAVGKMSKKDYVAKGIEAFQTAARRGDLIAFTCGLGSNEQDADETPGGSTASQKTSDQQARTTYLLAMFLIAAEKHSYFFLKESYDARRSTAWMTVHPEYERPLGAPKGAAVQSGYSYTREFAHASVRLDIEKETGEIVWKKP